MVIKFSHILQQVFALLNDNVENSHDVSLWNNQKLEYDLR